MRIENQQGLHSLKMKKILSIIALAAIVSSCSKQMDNAMKSTDKDLILKTADEFYAKKKWSDALALYERASKLVAGTDEVGNVLFKSAYAEYYDGNYKLAGHHFKKFAGTFPQDPRVEEASYMAALCYYKGSMDYNLDQSSTELAVNELQDFLNNYPDSERSKNIRSLIDELTYKLEYKAYENAKQYFKMAEYKASNVTFENVLEDFPATKLRPEIYSYILKSRYHLALNSVYSLKAERIENALAYTRFLEKEMPGTDVAKTALELRGKLETEKVEFAKVQKQFEEQKARLEAKQKAEQARLDAKAVSGKNNKDKDVTVLVPGAAAAKADSIR